MEITDNDGVIMKSGVTNEGDESQAADKAHYFGDKDTDGTWRIMRSGDHLVFQRRETNVYVTKYEMTDEGA